MNPQETPNTPGSAGPAVSSSPPPTSSGVDQSQFLEELNRVRAERDQLAQGLQQLRPYAEDIEWLTQDPDNQKFLRESRKAYESARQSRQQVPDELRPIAEKVDKLDRFVDEFTSAQQRAAAEPRLRWLSEGKSFAEDLMRKHPDQLSRQADPSMGWAGALQSLCESKGLTWEEGWKVLAPAFVPQHSGPPPTSMRADSGLTGLPPPSRVPTPGSAEGKKLGAIVLERLQSMQT